MSAVVEKTWAVDDLRPPLAGLEAEKEASFSMGNEFFEDGKVQAALFYFQRRRVRYNVEKNYHEVNLDHATAQARIELESGFIDGKVGVDLGFYGSADFRNKGAPDHEMNFEPWRDPWHPDWSKNDPIDGVSFYKAHLKFKLDNFWAKAGYFQPSGPGVLGVNWSWVPGTYLGGEGGWDHLFETGRLSTAMAIVTDYKSPWFKRPYHFYQSDKESRIPFIWTVGARYDMHNGLTWDLGYGESRHYLRSAHAKIDYQTAFSENPLKLGYHLYLVGDQDNSGSVNDVFDGLSSQHYAYAHYEPGLWQFKTEFTYSRAPVSTEHQVGYFVYRLTVPTGSSNGAYSVWWDARSDWNHHEEKAIFCSIGRKLDDFGLRGWTASSGFAYGWGGKAYEVAETLKEHAFIANLNYTVPDGRFKGIIFNAHWTTYKNKTQQPSWTGFKNAFQDEKDLKLMLIVPFGA